MSSTLRRSVIASVVIAGAVTLTPALAHADDYAPAVPSPSVSGVKVEATQGAGATTAPIVASTGGSALPRTGADVAVWTITGGALILGGTAMVATSRHRKTARH